MYTVSMAWTDINVAIFYTSAEIKVQMGAQFAVIKSLSPQVLIRHTAGVFCKTMKLYCACLLFYTSCRPSHNFQFTGKSN